MIENHLQAVADAIPFHQIKKVLITKLRHHGDVLLTSPVFSVLKNHHAHLSIDALVYRETRPMLIEHPCIDQVFFIDRGWKKKGLWQQVRHETQLLHQLRAQAYDLIIHLTESNRGLWLAYLLSARYRVVAQYPHRQGMIWRNAFTHHYPLANPRRHVVEKHLDALRRVGIQPTTEERKLVLAPGNTALQDIQQLMRTHGLRDKQFIHLHPTSRWQFKCWPEAAFHALIERLTAAGEQLVITCAPDKKELDRIERILAGTDPGIVNLAGELNLKELAALTAQASVFVGVDSAPMHIASAMQTPVVVLFGPSGELEWGPWQVPHKTLTTAHSCRPCGLDGCGGGKISECLVQIPVDAVYDAILTLKKTA